MNAAAFARLVALIPDPLVVAGGFLIAGLLITWLALQTRPITRFLCQSAAFIGFTTMLLVAGVTPFQPTPKMGWSLTYIVVSVLKTAWWLAGSWLLSDFFRAVLVYKRPPRETRLLQDLMAGFIFISAVLAVIANVFDMPVNGLLAASGVIAIVLGLALQSTLGDVFSGIVLNLAKPYHPGDWIILDGGLQGRVIETNWRATQILTDQNDLAIIPNSLIAKAKLVNASNPTQAHGVRITIRLDPTVAPSRGCAVLETALLSCNKILRSPQPIIAVRLLDAIGLECDVLFFIPNIELSPDAQNEVFDMMFRHLTAAGIRVAPPAASSFTLPPLPPRQAADIPRRMLDRLAIFAPLSEEERLALAPKMVRRTYKAGDVLLDPGKVAQSLVILGSGVLVALQGTGAAEREVMRLAPGDCVGEGGVLTGAAAIFKVKALTKVIVYEIGKVDLAPVLTRRPAIAADLGQILARREEVGKSRLEAVDLADKHSDDLGARLAERVRELFGIKQNNSGI